MKAINNPTKPTKQTIMSILWHNRDQIRALGVRKLGIFGSVARDEARADSDIDILVEFRPGHNDFDRFMQLAGLLEELFQRPVDLLTVESVSPYLKPYIMDEIEYVPLVA